MINLLKIKVYKNVLCPCPKGERNASSIDETNLYFFRLKDGRHRFRSSFLNFK